MLLLVLGLILFVGVHLVSAVPVLRESLVEHLGEWPYKGVVAAVALLGLVLAAIGYGSAAPDPVWDPLPFAPVVTVALMPVACVLVAAAYMPSNLKRYTAHPMLWGVVLWALAHLMVRGDMPSLVLFGGIGAYAVLAMIIGSAKGQRPSPEIRQPWRDFAAVGAGLLLFAVLLGLHPFLFGVAVMAG